jgi:hypothetical protein
LVIKDSLISKDQFVEAFSSEALKNVLTSSGFRAFFYNEFTTSPPEVKSAFERRWAEAETFRTAGGLRLTASFGQVAQLGQGSSN